MKKFICQVSDYEHSGDLEHEVRYIKEQCSQACNFHTYEERDYEAEHEYEREYGECDESIYNGFVEFEAPKECTKELEKIGCYERLH